MLARHRWSLLAALLAALAVAVGCSSPAPTAPVRPDWNGAYAATAVCGTVAQPVVRVDDDACPAGDAVVPGHPYRWYYEDWPDQDVDVTVVFVGDRLDVTPGHYRPERPARIHSALAVYRGAPRDPVAARVACGCTALTRATIHQRTPDRTVTAAQPQARPEARPRATTLPRSTTVQRGGLGAPNNRAAEAPAPRRDLSSPAPGRSSTPAAAAPAPRPAPPAPPAVRVATPAVKTGR